MRPIHYTLEVPDSLRSPEYDHVKLVREIEDQNRISVVSPEMVDLLPNELKDFVKQLDAIKPGNYEITGEVKFERRSNPSGTRPIWDEAMRLAKRQLVGESE